MPHRDLQRQRHDRSQCLEHKSVSVSVCFWCVHEWGERVEPGGKERAAQLYTKRLLIPYISASESYTLYVLVMWHCSRCQAPETNWPLSSKHKLLLLGCVAQDTFTAGQISESCFSVCDESNKIGHFKSPYQNFVFCFISSFFLFWLCGLQFTWAIYCLFSPSLHS